ncbi:PAP2-domain-containing protein [Pleomassaria siparia CBS 279.74]|uniref:PAP2-domain-containing protein n=1 Tax=Pleomassaria siparia CBS 279.74 TaxID=1314801 RepID=A0A6G1KTB9_9PLEO|nr:PAP2-domain-containing protein [Pleomassaria siparia CBS 279.74]
MSDIELNKPPPEKPRRNLKSLISLPDRPTFRTFIRLCWLDILTQLLCTGLAFLLYKLAPPLAPKHFMVYPGMERSGVAMRYGKPYMKEYISTLVSAIVSVLVPLLVLLAVEAIRGGGFWEVNSAIMGLCSALATTTVFQAFLKFLIGGLRPNFLDICQPSIIHGYSGIGYGNIWHTPEDVCTGSPKDIREAQMSFPSGHSSAAFAGFGFLALYLNAKFKILAQAPHWKMLLFVAPWLIATLLAASKVVDYWHHWSDVIAGSIIGILMAHVAYRMVYRGVYDARVNHLPRRR